jgi:hypothetical protein
MHRGPTDSGIFAVREMVFQEKLEKMLLVQKAALSVKPLCVFRNLRAMPSFWRRAQEVGPALAAIGSTYIVAFPSAR